MTKHKKNLIASPPAALLIAVLLVFSLSGFCITGCSSAEEEPADGDSEATDGDQEKEEQVEPEGWVFSVVESDGAGLQTQAMALNNGNFALAYFMETSTQGEVCEELLVDNPPLKAHWPLRYAEHTGDTWNTETITDLLLVGIPVGLDLKLDGQGAPAVATLAGEPVPGIRYCGASDTAIYNRVASDNWTIDTAVVGSGEAVTGDDAADYGDVVGYWQGLAYNAAGNPAVVYRDVHAGGMQADDFTRADLEIAISDGSGFTASMIDMGKGGGIFNRILFDQNDTPVVFYYVSNEDGSNKLHGVWAARLLDDGEWEKVRIYSGASQYGLSIGQNPDDGELVVAYYDASKGLPYIARLTNPDSFGSLGDGWELEEFGDHRFDEGYYPSLAIDSKGRILVSYYRCAKASSGLGDCKTDDDGLILARRDNNGDWEREIVDGGGEGNCGEYTALAINSDDEIMVAYQCMIKQEDNKFDKELKTALHR